MSTHRLCASFIFPRLDDQQYTDLFATSCRILLTVLIPKVPLPGWVFRLENKAVKGGGKGGGRAYPDERTGALRRFFIFSRKIPSIGLIDLL